MKLIITESQLRLIVENGIRDRVFNVPGELLEDKDSFYKMYKLYKDNKESKNYVGIKVIGDFNLIGVLGGKLSSELIDFCNNLVQVDGDLRVVNNYIVGLTLKGSKISELPELESVGGGLYLSHSKIESLPKLESTGGYLFLNDSPLADLGNLKSVGGDLDLGNCQIKSLPMLSYVEGGLTLLNSKISSLPMLEYVGDGLYLRNTPLSKSTTKEELRNKIEVKGNIYLWK